jgi:hypothetical protein
VHPDSTDPGESHKTTEPRKIIRRISEGSTMLDNTITHTHVETLYATVNLTPNDIQPTKREFLREWANRLGVTVEELLKRILIAAIEGSHYAEKIPEV